MDAQPQPRVRTTAQELLLELFGGVVEDDVTLAALRSYFPPELQYIRIAVIFIPLARNALVDLGGRLLSAASLCPLFPANAL